MTWIAALFIGLALGWVLELFFDYLFWSRRNRQLRVELGTCHSNYEAADNQLAKAQETVAQYKLKEEEYLKCQYDLTDLTGRHQKLETQADKVAMELESSQNLVDELGAQSTRLRVERDQLHTTLEDVDQWVESSMRRKIWNSGSWKSNLSRTKQKSVAFTRSIASSATSKFNQTAENVGGRVSTVRKQIDQALHQPWLLRVLNGTYCRIRGLVGIAFKKGKMPESCSGHSK